MMGLGVSDKFFWESEVPEKKKDDGHGHSHAGHDHSGHDHSGHKHWKNVRHWWKILKYCVYIAVITFKI